MVSSSEQARLVSLSREAAEALAAKLAAEMIQRWRQGERPLPEDFLARHPELRAHPVAVADLIYEEVCLRQEYGPEVPVEQVLARFPEWRPQLEVLLDCQRLLGPRRAAPQLPAAGESLGDFLLLAELGGGAQGRVFLATQVSLGGRPVVLKITPREAHEHLALASLQHTHIVPLYSVQDHPARGLRALCMPYFGGATLAPLLEMLRSQPPGRRTGQDLLDVLDRAAAALPIANLSEEEVCPSASGEQEKKPFAPCKSPSSARQFLARASYVEAACWVGACLAEALQYAHERGLVHLDLKPSNILLAADGQPMLLDFHLAREPIQPGSAEPPWLGGTAGYMSPEQQAALLAIQRGRVVPQPVDGRSDIYSLGVVLAEILGGNLPAPGGKPQPLHRSNTQVSVGLADLIGKCLAADPGERYPDMAALAADLRRHLAHRPLAGVRNRSLPERWRKWRRRRPYGLPLAGMLLAVLLAAGAVAVGAVGHIRQRHEQARTALNDGQVQMAEGRWDGAIRAFERGLAIARSIPLERGLAEELDRRLRLAEQGQAAAERAAAAHDLHQLADRARFLYGADAVPLEGLRGLQASCRAFWEQRGRIVERLSPAGPAGLERAARDDLLDLAIFWADLQVRFAPPANRDEGRRRARSVLAQAEALFGTSPVLDAERRLHGASARPVDLARRAPQTAWEHYALGRALLRLGDLERAAAEIEQAVRHEPQGLWPNFYQGLCAYRRGRYLEAATAYSVCIGAAPEAAGCFYNRGQALAALGRTEQARRDFEQASRLNPTRTTTGLPR